MRFVLLCFVPLMCGACGLLLTHGPPAGHEALPDFHCTTSVAGPLLDAVVATVGLGFTIKSVTNNDYNSGGTNEILVLGVVRASAWVISAAIGFDKVSKCARAKRQLAARRAAAPPAPGAAAPVHPSPVQAVEVTPGADTLTTGEQVQLVAKAFAPDGGVFINKSFRWSTSDDAVASVSDSGVVTARGPGTVVIAANVDNVTGTARVVVVTQP